MSQETIEMLYEFLVQMRNQLGNMDDDNWRYRLSLDNLIDRLGVDIAMGHKG